jgi:short-subunit dehydrogenase
MIFGGTGEIGRAAARTLRARGYALPLAARDPAPLSSAAAELGDTTFSAKG